MPDPSVPELISLCRRVLAAGISADELRRAWPDEPADPRLAELRVTLFSGLEHMPGTIVDGRWQLDEDAWHTAVEYDDIEQHLERLWGAR
jgi:hypothetical protein